MKNELSQICKCCFNICLNVFFFKMSTFETKSKRNIFRIQMDFSVLHVPSGSLGPYVSGMLRSVDGVDLPPRLWRPCSGPIWPRVPSSTRSGSARRTPVPGRCRNGPATPRPWSRDPVAGRSPANRAAGASPADADTRRRRCARLERCEFFKKIHKLISILKFEKKIFQI